MAKKKGVPGWHSMRKEQLVRALVRLANSKKKKPAAKSAAKNGATKSDISKRAVNGKAATKNGAARNGRSKPADAQAARAKNSRAARKIKRAQAVRDQLKDLATSNKGEGTERDRMILMVRDSYWLHVHWEISRQSVERVRASFAEQWHTARPILRLLEVESGATTSSAEQVVEDIEIHGGVNNWYIDVLDPPKSYRVAIGYLADNGKFHALVRSNSVTTPVPGSADEIDENWTEIAENYEKVYALSGGYVENGSSGDLRELFEERLRRPMGSPVTTQYGVGADGLARRPGFQFEVDAEMIIYGCTRPNACVTLSGEPVKVRGDGSFTVRLSMPDKRQVLPVVANSADGVEQRTVVLAIERNTKVMEPMIRDPNE